MKLDNLKEIWHRLEKDDRAPVDGDEIMRMLQKKSQSPIARMKRNLLVELVTVIILYSIPIRYFLTTSMGRYREIGIFLLVIGTLSIIYFYIKHRLLSRMQCVTCEVRSNLHRQLAMLEKYILVYFVCGTILGPVAYFFTGFIVLLRFPANNVFTQFTASNTFIIFVSIGVLITIGSYFLNKWYINKLYGQHIYKLKQLLLQMEEQEAD